MPLTKDEQAMLAKLLAATACLLVRSNPSIRRQVISTLLATHADEVVREFIEKAA